MAGSGILFPDVWGTIGKVAAIERADAERNAFAEDRALEKADAPHVNALLKGDRTALDRVSPKTALKLAPYLQQMDAGQRTKAKEAADYTARASNAILQAAPAERPAIYAQLLEDGKARGLDLSKLPPQYTPDLEPKLRSWRMMADQFLKEDGGVTYAAPVGGGGGDSAAAIGGIESGGKYDAVGPVANAQGHRAYGKYQVLEPNVGPWTQEVLGKAMTPQEFLANPQAQDAVFKAKFGQYEKKYGPEGAARAWFAGENGMNNPNAKDVLGTTVAGYGQKFAQATGAAPAGMPQGDGGPPGSPAGAGPQAPAALAPLRGLQLPPGARVALQKGVPIVKDGNVLYIDAQGGWGAAPLPQRAEPRVAQPPPGYEPNPDGSGLRPIPGGPADAAQVGRLTEARRRADEKAIPTTVTKGVQENLTNLKQVDKALAALEKYPGGVGGLGSNLASILPGVGNLQNRIDTEGTDLRALIGNIGSLIIHERSGAAVTAAEFPRLKPFIPTIADDPETARKKLTQFKAAYEEIVRDTLEYYGPNNGFREYKPATEYINRGGQAAPAGGPDQGGVLFEARDAISKGAPREAVIERLLKMGVDPSGL